MNGIGLAATLIFILGGSYYLTQLQMKSRGEKISAPPTWQTQKLTKEQQKSVKEQRKVFREEIYKEYPQADRFERVKRNWKIVLVLLYMLISVSRLFILINEEGNTGMSITAIILSGIIGGFIGVFLLLTAMCLTLIPRNRRLAEQTNILYEQVMKFIPNDI